MEVVDALPEVRWDVLVMQTDEELVTGDGREQTLDTVYTLLSYISHQNELTDNDDPTIVFFGD